MTSFKQIEANRRNAQKSTGPNTPEGKQRSRCSALRHGLTAETVIGILESAEDYTAFEASIMAEYDAQSAVARELVARLASLLWRLRRATAIETGLFEIQADPLAGLRRSLEACARPAAVLGLTRKPDTVNQVAISRVDTSSHAPNRDPLDARTVHFVRADNPNLTQCFLRLASESNFAFDRLSRYEASLWRQADQIIFSLNGMRRSRE